MKKTLLLTAALAASCTAFAWTPAQRATVMPSDSRFEVGPMAPSQSFQGATRVGGSMDFTYADDPYTALSLKVNNPGTDRAYMMFQMKSEDIKKLAGNQIVGFTVYSPTDNNLKTNTITDGQFFYSVDMKTEAYSQDFKFSTKPLEANYIALDTPYTISGDESELFFGYSLIVPQANDMYYVPVDGMANDYQASCLVNSSATGQFPASGWQTAASAYGALCMSVRIEGDNLPQNEASITSIDTPMYLPMDGNGGEVAFIVRNNGENALTSIEMTASMPGMTDVKQTFNFNSLAYGKKSEAVMKGLKGTQSGYQTLTMRITKVNGVDFDGIGSEVKVPVYDGGFPRKIVAEDATGTWCGWCPGGIEALEYLKKTYPDRAIAIGAHNGDSMAIDSYQAFIQAYVSGFPTVIYNRTIQQTPTSTYDKVCSFIDAVAEYLDVPSYAEVTLEGTIKDDNTAAVMKATSKFAMDINDTHYLSFVIIENGVGPYQQANYFKTYNIAMNGWEKKATKVSMKYDDVARYYNKFPGIENSIPSNIKANEPYEYEIELPLFESNGNKIVKGDEFTVVALLTSKADGRIVNACQLPMKKVDGVKAISTDDNITIEGGNGQVIVNGANAYSVYTLAGVKVANNNLPAGLYIVVADGKSAKVIVK